MQVMQQRAVRCITGRMEEAAISTAWERQRRLHREGPLFGYLDTNKCTDGGKESFPCRGSRMCKGTETHSIMLCLGSREFVFKYGCYLKALSFTSATSSQCPFTPLLKNLLVLTLYLYFSLHKCTFLHFGCLLKSRIPL